jgi:hypothetical protein
MSQREPALLVLGMHRSGTSALARCLMLHGLAAPAQRMGPAPDNPRGFWEPPRVQQLNDRLLKRFRLAWDDPRIIDWPRVAPDRMRLLRREAAAALASSFPDGGPFVLKEPRLARLLPIWMPVLAEGGVEPRIVLALRHPAEVMASLVRRNRLPRNRCLLLWLGHVLAAEHDTRHLPRATVRHVDLVADWRAALAPVMSLLPAGAEADAAAIDAFLTRELRHHDVGAGTAAVLPDGPLAELASEVFAELDRGAPDPAALDAAGASFTALLGPGGMVA